MVLRQLLELRVLRMRYIRESPTCAIVSLSSKRSAATTVVPMPSHWVCGFEVWWMILLARCDRVAQDDAGPVQAELLVAGSSRSCVSIRLAHEARDRPDRDAARDFAGVVAAHAVGEDDEPDVAVGGMVSSLCSRT